MWRTVCARCGKYVERLKDLAIVGGMNFDDAAGKDEEREFDLLEKSVRGRGSPTPDVADRE